jgi:putative inorganic carbon (HCO3(-)) transporter
MKTRLGLAAQYLTYGSAISILFSIAVSQILLGLALAAWLASGEKLRFPPVQLPLALFFAATVLSLALSGHAQAGLPQIRKFFVFGMLLAASCAFRTERQIRVLVLSWAAVATVAAAIGFVQFVHRWQLGVREHAPLYMFVLDSRITGFTRMWMTFGGEQMIVFLMLAAFLLFAKQTQFAGWVALLLIGASIVLGLTRSIFLAGVPAGMVYLVWNWRRWVVLALIPLAVVVLLLSPSAVQNRVRSAIQPQTEMDTFSKEHRAITRRVGWEMIKGHPWFGVGPEQVGAQFESYLPPDIPQPLPRGWYGHLHNIYLQYAAERGIPAALFLFWFIGKMVWDFRRALKNPAVPAEIGYVLHGAIAVIVAILVEGFFEHNLGDSEVLTLFLAVAGCGYSVTTQPHSAVEQKAAKGDNRVYLS